MKYKGKPFSFVQFGIVQCFKCEGIHNDCRLHFDYAQFPFHNSNIQDKRKSQPMVNSYSELAEVDESY